MRTLVPLPRAQQRAAFVIALLATAVACGTPGPSASAADHATVNDARSAFERGKRLALLGDSLRAEQYLAAALEQGHAPAETLRWLVGVCVKGSRLRAAIHYAEPYIEAHPEAIALRYVLAALFLGLGQPLRAREHLLEVVARAPGWADAHYLLGVVQWEGFRDRALAREQFRDYLERDPEGPHAQSSQAWLARHADAARAEP